MISSKPLLTGISGLILSAALHAQIPMGSAMNGAAQEDYFGSSISMPDARTIAIGAFGNDGRGDNVGQVRIMQWESGKWNMKGSDIFGAMAGEESGFSVSMPDENTVAIGAPENSYIGIGSGEVKVYTWDGAQWVVKGSPLRGNQANEGFGTHVAMPNANTLVVASPFYDHVVNGTGRVKVFLFENGNWVQKGMSFYGDHASEYLGSSISMPDENTLAIGSADYKLLDKKIGRVQVYSWNGAAWVQKAGDLVGTTEGAGFASSISMPDANTLAIGEPNSNVNGVSSGKVSIFRWNGSAWQKKGPDINGKSAASYLGKALSMPDSMTIAISAPNESAGGKTANGVVRVYEYRKLGTFYVWSLKGTEIEGLRANDDFGWTVYMPDNNTVAAGTPFCHEAAFNAGQVRVFRFSTAGTRQPQGFSQNIRLYPNPSSGTANISGLSSGAYHFAITDLQGRIHHSGEFQSTSFHFDLSALPAGSYHLQLTLAESQERVVLPVMLVK